MTKAADHKLEEQIIEAAYELGQNNATIHETRNVKITAEAAAARTALESLFDGAEHLNNPHNRTRVNLSFRLGYSTAQEARA